MCLGTTRTRHDRSATRQSRCRHRVRRPTLRIAQGAAVGRSTRLEDERSSKLPRRNPHCGARRGVCAAGSRGRDFPVRRGVGRVAQDGQSASKLTTSMCRVRRQNVRVSVARYRTTHPSENDQRYDGGGGVGTSRAERGLPAVRSNAAFNSSTTTDSNARRSSGAPGNRGGIGRSHAQQSLTRLVVKLAAARRFSSPPVSTASTPHSTISRPRPPGGSTSPPGPAILLPYRNGRRPRPPTRPVSRRVSR